VPALDDPQTRTALAAHRAGALRWLGGGVIAVVLGVLLAAAAVRIARDSGEPLPFAGLMVIGLFLGGVTSAAVGIGGLVRTHRWTTALAREPWRLGRLRVAAPSVMHIEPVGFDEFTGEPLRLELSSTAVWRTRVVQALVDAEVSYAPVSGREWVFTADGVGTVFGARTPGRRR
jgi:hypothetical protein